MRLGTVASAALLQPSTVWELLGDVQGYGRPRGPALATQAWTGRRLRILEQPTNAERVKARLLDDGYPCWIERDALVGRAVASTPDRPRQLGTAAITERLPAVLHFALDALKRPNTYLWGGSLGPDYDCSGLVQRAFASAGIWIPRDAYLQERFCQPVAVHPGVHHALRPGDLIFFGGPRRCTHVGLHLGSGRYLHSSGSEHGRSGLGIDDLHPHNQDPVACHYRQELRGAGRVLRCHDGSALPA